MKWLALLLLTGCAIFPPDYKWTPMLGAKPFKSYEWHVKPGNTFNRYCGIKEKWDLWACAVTINESGVCHIYSNMTEQQAAQTMAGGGDDWPDVRSHELHHCEGWAHQRKIR